MDVYQIEATEAASQYKGKTVTITGKVAGANAGESSMFVTENGDPENDYGARYTLLSSEVSKIYDLDPKQTISIRSKIGEFSIDIYMTDCSIVP